MGRNCWDAYAYIKMPNTYIQVYLPGYLQKCFGLTAFWLGRTLAWLCVASVAASKWKKAQFRVGNWALQLLERLCTLKRLPTKLFRTHRLLTRPNFSVVVCSSVDTWCSAIALGRCRAHPPTAECWTRWTSEAPQPRRYRPAGLLSHPPYISPISPLLLHGPQHRRSLFPRSGFRFSKVVECSKIVAEMLSAPRIVSGTSALNFYSAWVTLF